MEVLRASVAFCIPSKKNDLFRRNRMELFYGLALRCTALVSRLHHKVLHCCIALVSQLHRARHQ
jgi:hypothetical protein